MVLPAGVSKGTGLVAALGELGISPHNAIAVGDAENDLALLEAAEVGVAVANAVPSLRQHADLVLDEPDGKGVVSLLTGPLVTGELPVRPARRRVAIGRFSDGSPATVPGAQANIRPKRRPRTVGRPAAATGDRGRADHVRPRGRTRSRCHRPAPGRVLSLVRMQLGKATGHVQLSGRRT